MQLPPQIVIHRAAEEIGGSCIEISSGVNRILLDFGLPLSAAKEKKAAHEYRLPLDGAYKDQTPQFDAVFLTHAHPDHYGLLAELNPEIPVYAGRATINLLQNVAPLYGISLSHLRFVTISPGETVKYGSISVTAIAVDHSAPQAFAYQVETAGKTILYTGDLRAHGKCGYLTHGLARYAGPDYMLMEGTTLSRPGKISETESELQLRLEKEFSAAGLPVIYFSSQNLDRFVSVYKATRALKKTLVIDPYTCYVLEQFRHLGRNIPQWNWRGIRVYFAPNSITEKLGERIFRYAGRKISLKDILLHPEQFVIKDNFSIRRSLLKRSADIHLIHSSWEGYLKEEDNAFRQDALTHNLPISVIHTSGHGDYNTLRSLVNKLSPRLLIPVHTECPGRYGKLFDVPVRVLKNGEVLFLQNQPQTENRTADSVA